MRSSVAPACCAFRSRWPAGCSADWVQILKTSFVGSQSIAGSPFQICSIIAPMRVVTVFHAIFQIRSPQPCCSSCHRRPTLLALRHHGPYAACHFLCHRDCDQHASQPRSIFNCVAANPVQAGHGSDVSNRRISHWPAFDTRPNFPCLQRKAAVGRVQAQV